MAKLIPRNISYTHNAGRLLVDLSCEKLVTQASMAYEVTCPNEPDNDPEQPQEEVPPAPTWPDIGIGEVLCRNSFRSGNWHKVINDPIAINSIMGMSNPTMEALYGGANIPSNVVGSNRYVYWMAGGNLYRKAIQSGCIDKNFPYTVYNNTYAEITLVEENVLARVARDTSTTEFHLIKGDFLTGTETVLASIQYYYEDDYLLQSDGNGVFINTIVGSDNKIYIIFNLLKYLIPDPGDWGFSDIHFYIYNYTDDVLYDPVVLDLWDLAGVNDIVSVYQYIEPAIVHSELVIALNFTWAGAFPDNNKGTPFFCVNVETQAGQSYYFKPYSYRGTTCIPGYAVGMVSDRIYRRVYCVMDADANPYDPEYDDFPIVRYDLASNEITFESHHPRIDFVGPVIGGNYPWLMQDKNYAYKLTNLFCADTTGTLDLSNCTSNEPLFSRIEFIGDTVMPTPLIHLPYLPDERYQIDDVNTGVTYTLTSNGWIWQGNYERFIIDTSPSGIGNYDSNCWIELQCNHILLINNQKVWVIY